MDFDLNWLQFLSNQEMQALLSENLFADALMEDSSLPALLGGSPNLFHQTSRLSGSEIFAVTEDSNANLAGDLQQCFAAGQNMTQSAGTSQCNSSLTGIEPPTGALSAFPSDPAFVERAAKYSSFVKENSEKDEESAGIVSNGNGNERGFTSAMSGNEEKYGRRKKRRNVDKAVNSEGPKRKRCKRAESEKKAVEDSKRKEEQSKNKYCTAKTEDGRNVKAPAPPDYIHVRARRGQATDSHSLAERARREKISERMKILQNLVPGCSKSTSKALMLDEIINHVQSLQRQVEYLSLKLATISPVVDFDMYRFSC